MFARTAEAGLSAFGVGPRVLETSLNRIPLHDYTAPFEDLKTN